MCECCICVCVCVFVFRGGGGDWWFWAALLLLLAAAIQVGTQVPRWNIFHKKDIFRRFARHNPGSLCATESIDMVLYICL